MKLLGTGLLAIITFIIIAWLFDLLAAIQLVVWSFAIMFTLVGLVLAGYFAATAIEKFRLTRAERQAAESRVVEADNRAWAAGIVIAAPGHQVYLSPGQMAYPAHLLGEISRWQYHQQVYGKRSEQPIIEIEQPLQLPQQDIVGILSDVQRLMLLGASGSGKSSLLRHIISAKLRNNSNLVLIDPHGARPKWGNGIDAVGFGERWNEIIEIMERLEWQHTKRIKQIEHGHPERGFPIVTVVIEELQSIVEYFQQTDFDIGHYMRMFLTRTRKTGIDIIVATQAKGVKATGLEGFSENRDSFLTAKTIGHDGRGHRVLFLDDNGTTIEYDPPALWPDTRPVGIAASSILQLPVAPTSEERRILELLSQGISKNEICQRVWGSKNKVRFETIEAVLARFNDDISGVFPLKFDVD